MAHVGGRHRADRYPPDERGRRVLWRSVTVGLYLLVSIAALWLSETTGWSFKILLGAVAVPYWYVVMVIWSRWGPYMPGL